MLATMRARAGNSIRLLEVGNTRVTIHPGWLTLAGAGVVLLALFGLPLYAPALDASERWVAAIATVTLVGASLLGHVVAHLLVARQLKAPLPNELVIGPLGDQAHQWPAGSLRADVASALAGPLVHACVALLAYLAWDAQLHPLVSAVAFGVFVASTLLALVLLAPGYPCDGGRLMRHTIGARATLYLGRGAALLFTMYGLFVIGLGVNGVRFGIEVGVAIAVSAIFVFLLQRGTPVGEDPLRRRWLAPVAMTLLIPPLALTPLLNGLYSPGNAVAVGPMIEAPADRRFASRGELLLTTVFLQTPITAGQWLQAQIERGYTLVPPEQIIPRDTTPEQAVRRSVSMLEASEATALVLGTQLAGLPATITSTAVLIVDIAPESPARAVLQPGDRLLAVGGDPVRSLAALSTALRARQPGDRVALQIERDDAAQIVDVTLLPPVAEGGAPRIGISAEDDGLEVDLPFPIAITTQKIVGGPSAGLMFTLAVYDALTPEDLTRGRQIAGTGTIDREGRVGPIGGIAQKVVAAERAGATIFLTPPDHLDEARRNARSMQVVPVATAQEAIAFLQAP